MHFTRRQFMGLAGVLGLGACKRLHVPEVDLAALKPSLSMPSFTKDSTFSFAAINDLHVTDAKSTAIVKRAVRSINENANVAFTVVLGDLASAGTVQEMTLAKTSLDDLEQPYFAIPGNHDVDMSLENEYANYNRAFPDRQWKQDAERWLFLGLDTCNGTASDVTVPEDRLEWLQKQLRGVNKQRPIALFTHHPLNPNTKAYRVQNADSVLALFEGHSLKLVASGHFHGNQEEEQNGVLFTTTACCSTTRDNHDDTPAKGYRLFHIDHETITHEFVEVRG